MGRDNYYIQHDLKVLASHASKRALSQDQSVKSFCLITFLQVSFLAAILGPEVAAASAQKALEVLLEDDDAHPQKEEPAAADSQIKTLGELGPVQSWPKYSDQS